MNLPRRTFLKSSLAVSASAALGSSSSAAQPPAVSQREYYELRCYHLSAGRRFGRDADSTLLDRYLEQAMLPALERRRISPVGVFTELEVDKKAGTSKPMPGSPVWVLIPHASLDSYVQVAATLNEDRAVQQAGSAYLEAPKSAPAFQRFDSWLLLAFRSLPKIELPEFARNRTPTRVYEMRDYESHSELKALNKMAMFDDGETQLMRDLGMAPVFFGQALSGPDLPHLRYMTSGPDLQTHLANWGKFGPDPRWQKMSKLPEYADNTSRNTARFLTPKPYSQL